MLIQNSNKKQLLIILFAFFAIYFVWGTTYLAISFALKGFKPFTISALRFFTAGVMLAGWIWFKGLQWPNRQDFRVLVISGILMLSGGSGLVVVGEQYISSGAAAVIMATEPLFFVLFDRSRWAQYFTNRKIIVGLIIGFAGIALFSHYAPMESTVIHSRPILGTFITLLSAVVWVIGALYANRKLSSKNGNLVNSSIQLIAAGIFSAMIAAFKGEWPALLSTSIPVSAWIGLSYLIVMGSLVAYLCFNWLITVHSPAIVSTHTYVNPVIAILMGWMLASESVSGGQWLALIIVLAGVLITQLNKDTTPVILEERL